MNRLAIVACAVLAVAAAPVSAQQLVERSTPEVGVEAEAEIGQPLMRLERVYQAPAIRLASEVTTETVSLGKIVLPPGVYALAATNKKGRYYRSMAGVKLKSLGTTTHWDRGGILLPTGGGPPKGYWESDIGIRNSAVAPGAEIVDAGIEDLGTDGFKVELLYGGVTKGTVKLSYREFMRDMARPAFSQELAYDLADGDEIGFRGARLKVVKATNVSIRYVVVKPLARPTP